ncbi:MAG: hypothetical protein GXZ07_03495 [Firmicutes bacterium]|nr:hypothetical protein [Bacillota bacterium]
MKICIDPGHGGSDPGATGNGLMEKILVLEIALRLKNYLLSNWQCEVKMTRETDMSVPLKDRSAIANAWGADFYFSVHCNGHTNQEVNGWESFVYTNSPQRTKNYQAAIHKAIWSFLSAYGTSNRGIKTANFQVLRETKMSAVLGEYLFVSGNIDSQLLRKTEIIDGMARATAEGIALALGLEKKDSEQGTPILGAPQASIAQAREWARNRNAHQRFIDIASFYWNYGKMIGIRPEVAYSQAAKETAFGHYGGAVDPAQNNWAGIKTRNASGDRQEDHETFSTPEDGVRAHFNHLAAYVGLIPIGEPHGRYLLVKSLPWAGTVRTVEELGGKWAPNLDYGKSIVRDYLTGLLATKASPEGD